MQLPLSQLALFDVTGDDAASFLQGQLTQDVQLWQPHEIKRAAWCTVKGRMLASFYLWPIDGGFRLLVAQDLVAKLLPRLRMFVMRAKVLVSEPLDRPLYACHSPQAALSHDGTRYTLLASGFGVSTDVAQASPKPADWLLAHIQAGVAWVSAANSEQFVPQTANFELVGGVNFRKGCYPGQEIVARSQYLGKLKQRAAIAQVTGVALVGQAATVLMDVFSTGQDDPVGRVIQASGDWVLIEAPNALMTANAPLCLGSPSGAALALQPLPYAVLDVTA
jgi:tRNA-modifying protein YgfZ